MTTTDGKPPFADGDDSVDARIAARDLAARARAVDPRFNVVLEASAGTGKTRVLVDRYINLLRAGVDPANILAMTFTRKAAAEMRDRIMATLRVAAAGGEIPPARWRELRDRTADITISTIDAFCLSLLREFPLEADVDPGFSMADDTELPRLIDEALDRTLRICRAAAREDEDIALVFAQLGERRARAGLTSLLQRRIVAPRVLASFLAGGPADLDVATVSRGAAASLLEVFESMRGGFERFTQSGPLEPAFLLLSRSLSRVRELLRHGGVIGPPVVQAVFLRAREYFLTQEGQPRSRSPYPQRAFANAADWRVHTDLVVAHAEGVARVSAAYRRDLNVLVSRGIWRMFRMAEAEYRRTLDAHAVLDFSDLLLRTLDLLRRMEEFARSRYRLESRYHHVLVDEFQDTSRAQWELVALLIQSWGEGAGLAETGPLQPSIFIVGDRKQSIYGFRDADVSVLREAARHIERLRPDRDVRRSIARSFRAVPPLLAFVNDACHDMDKAEGDEAFQYEETDRFPIDTAGQEGRALRDGGAGHQSDALGVIVGGTFEECAEMTAGEIARLLSGGVDVRDRDSGMPRPVRPGDIAILFRSRESHRDFEASLARRGIRSYVYKGLGFFDSDEVKDVLALVWYLADSESNLRAAAMMRSRFVGLSDEALRLLAPTLADALSGATPPVAMASLDPSDRRALIEAQTSTAGWRRLVDRVPPAELVDIVLTESAYVFELRGLRFPQARENLKKIRALLRRLQNRGYATLARVAAYLDRIAVGDEANAVVDALDAVNLMTVHAAKGLEFPVVFVVNLARGTGNRRDPVRLSVAPDLREGAADAADIASVAVGDFQSDADEARAAREREETKRLLYVAFTRARDRLYLATTLKEGRVVPGRGSLAEVLPASLLLECAAGAQGRVEWRASSGAVHQLRVCSDPGTGIQDAQAPAPHVPRSPEPGAWSPEMSDFGPLVDTAPLRRSVASKVAAAHDSAISRPARGDTDESDRLVGRVVHRLVQRFGFEAGSGIAPDVPLRMLRPEEVAGLSGNRSPMDVAGEAVTAYRAICGQADVRAVYMAGNRLHEIPFTMRMDDTLVRGTMDCLVRTAPDRMTVLEFKTGRPREEHRIQLDLYRRAAERLFPGLGIDTRLVYANQAAPA